MILIAEDKVLEGTDNRNDGQIVIASDTSDDGVLLVTSDVSGSISLDVYEQVSSTAIYSTTMAAASVIDNVPVPWRLDSVGRNWRHSVSLATLGVPLLGGKRYTFLYRVPTLLDGTLHLAWIWNVVPLPT